MRHLHLWRHMPPPLQTSFSKFEPRKCRLLRLGGVQPEASCSSQAFKQRVGMVTAVHFPCRYHRKGSVVEEPCKHLGPVQMLLAPEQTVKGQKHISVTGHSVAESNSSQQAPLPDNICSLQSCKTKLFLLGIHLSGNRQHLSWVHDLHRLEDMNAASSVAKPKRLRKTRYSTHLSGFA